MKNQNALSVSLSIKTLLSFLAIVLCCSTQQVAAQYNIKDTQNASILDPVEFKVETNQNQVQLQWNNSSPNPNSQFIVEAVGAKGATSIVSVITGNKQTYRLAYNSSENIVLYRLSLKTEEGKLIMLKTCKGNR